MAQNRDSILLDFVKFIFLEFIVSIGKVAEIFQWLTYTNLFTDFNLSAINSPILGRFSGRKTK